MSGEGSTKGTGLLLVRSEIDGADRSAEEQRLASVRARTRSEAGRPLALVLRVVVARRAGSLAIQA